jgi:hypothetical protein
MVLSRLFGKRRRSPPSRARQNLVTHGKSTIAHDVHGQVENLKRKGLWGDSDSDADYTSDSGSSDHGSGRSSPHGSGRSSPRPSSHAPREDEIPEEKKEPEKARDDSKAFNAKPVNAGSDDEGDVFVDAREAPPESDAPPVPPPVPDAPPMAPPMTEAIDKIAKQIDAKGLAEGIREGGEAATAAKRATASLVNKVINVLIAKETLTKQEGAAAKIALFKTAVKEAKKSPRSDLLSSIQGGKLLKPVASRPLAAPKKQSPSTHDDLMSKIQAGKALKHVSPPAQKPATSPPATALATALQSAMAKQRGAVAAESDEEADFS